MAEPAPRGPHGANGAPSLKASPQNPLLGAIATALANARGWMNPAPGTPLADSWFQPGNWLIGQSPEEVERWSYGNSPLDMGGPLGPAIPRVRPGRQEGLADALGVGAELTPSGAFAKAIAMRPSVRQGSRQGQKGAVRIKGAELPVATHASGMIMQPEKLARIREEGLYAPSIGLHQLSKNDYAPDTPAFLFRAGALDRPFENEAPGAIFNRDAYVWNPYKDDSRPIIEQWQARQRDYNFPARSKAAGDVRLSQMSTDKSSQDAAILSSPAFRSLAEWETSPFGRGALIQARPEFPDQGGPTGFFDYEAQFNNLLNELYAGGAPAGLVDRLANPANRQDPDVAALFDLARRAPSEMGEMKIYAPSVPAGPNEAVLWVPNKTYAGDGGKFSEPWHNAAREMGYALYGPDDLRGLAQTEDISKPPLHLLAPSTGMTPPSPEEAAEMLYYMRGWSEKTPVTIQNMWSKPEPPAWNPSAVEVDEFFNDGPFVPSVQQMIDEWMKVPGDVSSLEHWLKKHDVPADLAEEAQNIYFTSPSAMEGLKAVEQFLKGQP